MGQSSNMTSYLGLAHSHILPSGKKTQSTPHQALWFAVASWSDPATTLRVTQVPCCHSLSNSHV